MADQLLTNIQQVLQSVNQSIKLSIKHWSMQGTGLVCRIEVYEIKSKWLYDRKFSNVTTKL